MQRIVLLGGNDPRSNPRVVKEAEALAAVGYAVKVLGLGIGQEYRKRDARLVRGVAEVAGRDLDAMKIRKRFLFPLSNAAGRS